MVEITACYIPAVSSISWLKICITPPLICPLIYGHINFTPNQCLCIKIKIKRSVGLNFEIVWAYRVIYFLVKSRFFEIKCILWAKIILYKDFRISVCKKEVVLALRRNFILALAVIRMCQLRPAIGNMVPHQI